MPDPAASDTPESSDQLLRELRMNGVGIDDDLVRRIDAAIHQLTDRSELGRMWLTRALAVQGRGEAAAPAFAAGQAVPLLIATGQLETAAFATAMAAVFLDQAAEPIAAIDHAVDALVMLGNLSNDHLRISEDGVRAALALSGFFMRLSAFDLAIDVGERAFRNGRALDRIPLDSLAFSFGYVAVEGGHVTTDEHTRSRYLAHAHEAATWLADNGTNEVAREMLADGLYGEILHARQATTSPLGLDRGERLYPVAPPDLVAWHLLVRGTAARRIGEPERAIELLDLAIPGLELSADDHCLVRALDERAQAKVAIGDLAGAYADADDLAHRTRRWQVDQVGRLAFQLARRADLERSTTELQRTTERLTDDVNRDPTTGVKSRRWLERRLDQLRDASDIGTIVMCDIDHFKRVNDNYGHHVGDTVLRRFGTLLDEVVASTFHDDAAVARFGGEEFVVVLVGHPPEAGERLAETLRNEVQSFAWTALVPDLEMTMSCGHAAGPCSDMRNILVRADEALLVAKRDGRNRVRSFESRAHQLS